MREALAAKWLKTKMKTDAVPSQEQAVAHVAKIDRQETFDKAFSRYAENADKGGATGIENFYRLDGKLMPPGKLPDGTGAVAVQVAHSKEGSLIHAFKTPKIVDDNGEPGRHAIAYHVVHRKILRDYVLVFDPNCGEYAVPRTQFEKWMPEYVSHYYGTKPGDSNYLNHVAFRDQPIPTPGYPKRKP